MEVDFSLIALQANILVVDDTKENLSLLTQMLKDCNYIARPVPNGRLALCAAKNEKPDLILLDISMPEMDGYEVCRQLKRDPQLKEIPVIFISALCETYEKVKAFEVGGVDYITKPFQFEEVKARVKNHLNLYRLKHNLEDQVQKQVKEITELQMGMLFGLAKLAEARDLDTGRHLERIQILCKLFAEKLHQNPNFNKDVDDAFCELLFFASPLHDIGKVGIADHILLKPGRLTPEEFEIMKTHTTIGVRTLEEVQNRFRTNKFLTLGIQISRSHHENWDGHGYPDGLVGAEIPLCARIMAIVDTYDAMRSKRVYKPAISHEDACSMIMQESRKRFDPALVEVFFDMRSTFDDVWMKLQG